MSNLTFGEQVKIVLSRKGMTIKELAEMIEERTGKKMSRQNLTQRLGRDNFQEQDMRMIASILECPFELSILGDEPAEEAETVKATALAEEAESTEIAESAKIAESAEEAEQSASVGEQENARSEAGKIDESVIDESAIDESVMAENGIDENASEESEAPAERGLTVGEFLEIQEEMDETSSDKLLKEVLAEMDAIERENKEWEQETQAHSEEESTGKPKKGGWLSHLRFRHRDEAKEEAKEDMKEEAKENPKEGSTAGVSEAVSQNESGGEKEAEEGKAPIGQQEAEKLRQEKGNLVYFSEQRGLAGTSLKEKAENAENAGEANRAEDISKTAGDKIDEAAAEEENTQLGDVNPYTGREYATNSVRMHPKRIGYVQVYSRKEHKWTDMTEWAFLGYQERKKELLGKDYEPPIYLD